MKNVNRLIRLFCVLMLCSVQYSTAQTNSVAPTGGNVNPNISSSARISGNTSPYVPAAGAVAWTTRGNANIQTSADFIGPLNAADFIFKTNSVERMRILSTGNVGIGLGSNIAKTTLQIGSSFAIQTEDFSIVNNYPFIGLNAYNLNTGKARINSNSNVAIMEFDYSGNINIKHSASGAANSVIAFDNEQSVFYNDGKVSIGGSFVAPVAKLSLKGNAVIGSTAFITSVTSPPLYGAVIEGNIIGAGSLGIGSSASPAELVQFGDRFVFHNGGTKILGRNFRYTNNQAQRMVANEPVSVIGFNNLGNISFEVGPSGPVGAAVTMTPAMIVGANGKVGIGTDPLSVSIPASYKLIVEGTIGAREVVVATGTWPDYVFTDDYELQSINDVSDYINKNKHLPGIPSAEEIVSTGQQVGELQKMQQQKIEELYLYIIELQNRLEKLESKK